MHALARLAILKLDSKGVAPKKVLRATHILDETCLELCEGQYLDISYESRFDINTDAYLEMIDRKTAALMSCSLELGALVGTEDETTVRSFQRFGRKLGLAYQMVDDVLGIWGGKSSISDIQKKKKTLPVIYALERARGEERAELLAIYGQETVDPEGVGRAIQILSRLGAKEYTQEMARKYYREALGVLEGANLSPQALKELKEVTSFLVEREY
jgi:geranylgeranyl diphosphate synthase type I